MANKKDRVSPIVHSLPDLDDTRTPAEMDRDEAIERLDRLEWDDLKQKDRELQKAFQDIDDSQKRKVGIKYDSRQKLRAALAYITTGSSVQASRLTGVPPQCIRYWKQEAPWWPTAIKYAMSAQKEGLDAKLGQVADKYIDAVLDRADKGDPIVVKEKYKDENGIMQEKIRIEYIPIKVKDMMVVAAVARDKQAVLRGEPTSISEKKSDKDILNDVAAKLAETIAQHTAPKGIVGTFDKDGNKVDGN